ncbi:MAG: aminotransferase class IV [Pseudomonadota bacterium]
MLAPLFGDEPARGTKELAMQNSDFRDGCAFVRGNFVPIADAMIPITDTGFTRSDVTYDVVAVWDGKFFRLQQHLDRFEKSWQAIDMRPGVNQAQVREVLHQCVSKSGLRNAYVEMLITRGVPTAGERDPRNFINQFYAFAIPYIWIADAQEQQQGVDLVISKTAERISPQSVDPTVKNFHWGDLNRGLREALEAGAKTAVLLDNDGWVTEGPGFNIFAFVDGRLVTPASGVLLGITRQTILDLANEQGIDCEIGELGVKQLQSADEIFLTSTAGGVMPVRSLDGQVVGEGKPGPLTMSLRELYWREHGGDRWTEPVAYGDPQTKISLLAS